MNKQASFDSRTLASPPFLLLALGATVIAIHLTLIFRIENSDRPITSMLFWATATYLIWERKDKLQFQTGPIASIFGTLLLALLLIKCTGYCEESFLIAYPFLSSIALAALASGFQGWRDYRREIVLLFFSGVPEAILTKVMNPAILTAQFAHSMLWYMGLPIKRDGIFLQLPGGTVEVYTGCSGLVAMTQLLGMSVLFLMLLPLPWKWYQKLILPAAAVAIGFFVNAVRVAIMAILVSQKQMAAFEYWHSGTGSLVFSVIGVGCLLALIWLLIKVFAPKVTTGEESQL